VEEWVFEVGLTKGWQWLLFYDWRYPISEMDNHRKPSSTTEDEQKEWVVEKVLRSRKRTDGTTEYLIKWDGWDDNDNTWEPEENLTEELVVNFKNQEKEKKMLKRTHKRRRVTFDGNETSRSDEDEGEGLEHGLDAEEIVAALLVGGKRMFSIKLRNVEEPILVSTELAGVECPQVVIKFYEEAFGWESVKETSSPPASPKSSCIII